MVQQQSSEAQYHQTQRACGGPRYFKYDEPGSTLSHLLLKYLLTTIWPVLILWTVKNVCFH